MPVTPAPGPPTPGWWMPNLVTTLGPPEADPDLERWTWQDGEIGVYVEKLTHAWQAVAWTPTRSVTLRSLVRPSNPDLARAIRLAGLDGLIAPPHPPAAARDHPGGTRAHPKASPGRRGAL